MTTTHLGSSAIVVTAPTWPGLNTQGVMHPRLDFAIGWGWWSLTFKSPRHFCSKNSPKLPPSNCGKNSNFDVYFWIFNHKFTFRKLIWSHKNNLVAIHHTDSRIIVFEVQRKVFYPLAWEGQPTWLGISS